MVKKNRNGVLIAISVVVMLGIFAIGMSLVSEHVDIQPISTETGRLEFIPIVRTTGNNTITMKLKYIPIAKNIDPFEYIYDHEESAITNTNHTELYKLSLSSVDNTTRVYRIEKIVNGTFIRILRMSDGLMEKLITPGESIYESGQFSIQVKTDAGNVYLYLTQIQKPEVEDTKT